MSRWLRRLRGFLGVGVTWGIGWSAVGALMMSIVLLLDPASIDAGDFTGMLGVFFTLGVISGSVFSLALAVLESRKSIRELSAGRMAVWGAVGASLLPLLTPVPDDNAIIMAPIGALFAAGSVALAKRAALRDEEEPDRLAPGPGAVLTR